MGEIVNFRNLRGQSVEENLSELIKRAKKMQGEEGMSDNKEAIVKSTFEKMQRMIYKDISNTIFKKAHVNGEYFLCGEYIAEMVTRTAKEPPETLYVIDHLAKVEDEKDYWNWQKAADLAFLICTLFRERADHRMMRYEDYVKMGKSLYVTFYNKYSKRTGGDDIGIGYLMSKNYETMARITRDALVI